MDYDAALRYIHGTEKFGSKLGLSNIKKLLNLLGNPQNQYKYIHISGTNGKGSVAAMLSSILREGGFRVGTFTSPYLEYFNERIQVDLHKISREELANLTQIVKEKVDLMVAMGHTHPTEFEIVTAIGLLHFANQDVQIAVVEVGLGGRLDATNIVDKPLLSIITSIGFDHMGILGNTLEEIAFEKAGIIKTDSPVVSYPQLEAAAQIIKQVVKKRNAALYEVSADQILSRVLSIDRSIFDFRYRDKVYEGLELNLVGEHQLLNAATVLTSINILGHYGVSVSNEAIYKGISKTKWPGRLEIIKKEPLIILDGAHNASGAEALANTIKRLIEDKKTILILAVLADKEIDAILKNLCTLADKVIVTEPNNPRALDSRILAAKVKTYCSHIYIEASLSKAIDMGLGFINKDDLMLICGSLYIVGEARAYLN